MLARVVIGPQLIRVIASFESSILSSKASGGVRRGRLVFGGLFRSSIGVGHVFLFVDGGERLIAENACNLHAIAQFEFLLGMKPQ